MKSFYARSLTALLAMIGAADVAMAQGFGSGSLLPIPSSDQNEVRQVGYTRYASRNRNNEDMPAPGVGEASPMGVDVGPVGSSYAPAESYQSGNGYAMPPVAAPMHVQSAPCASQPMVVSAPSSYIPADDSCNQYVGGGYGGPAWFVSAGGLVLNRSSQGLVPFSYDATTLKTILSNRDVEHNYAGGFFITAGRIIGCGNAAIGATYWGVYPQDSMIQVNAPAGGIRSPIRHDQLTYPMPPAPGGYRPADEYYRGTFNYLSRHSVYNNVEVNLYSNPAAWGFMGAAGMGGAGGFGGGFGGGCGDSCGDSCADSCGSVCGSCGPRLQCGWLAGFRYFNFNETYQFVGNNLDPMPMPSSNNNVTHTLDYKNNLYGFQMGGIGNLALNQCWSVFGIGKAGVFNNNIDGYQRVFGPPGDAFITNGDYAGTPVSYRSSRNGLAAMGELDLGFRYQHSCRLGVFAGYRVIGVAGVATPAGNVPYTFNDPRDQRRINSHDSLLLHGFFAGGTFCF